MNQYLEALEALGVTITVVKQTDNYYFHKFLQKDAARWTGGMEDSIYLPITIAKVELISPSTGDWSGEKSIIGDNYFFRRLP